MLGEIMGDDQTRNTATRTEVEDLRIGGTEQWTSSASDEVAGVGDHFVDRAAAEETQALRLAREPR